VIYYLLLLEAEFRKKNRKPRGRWRLDETYIKVERQWKYYYRAGETVDFLLTAKRDKKSALRYLK